MSDARIGCQTYTWEMLGEDWTGTAEDILKAVSAAGYKGVEFSNAMIGEHIEDPIGFAKLLEKHNLVSAAFAYAKTGFTEDHAFEADLAGAGRSLGFCSELGIPLCLGGAASPTREDRDRKLAQAARLYRTVAEMGGKKGVTVCVHPHSHHGSLLETAEEYDEILSLTEESGLMFNPDAGHIVRGGQDLMDCVRRHRKRIAHVHIKDVDEAGRWKALGDGVIDWEALVGFLRETAYQGWIVAEEESDDARRDPNAAIVKNRRFLKALGA